jgi:hypothetical protein
MSYWKTLTSTNLRVYFPVKVGGNLSINLSPSLFTVVLINPGDTSSSISTVEQSTQKPGIYYTDIDSNFLISNGIGMYGLSIGVHKNPPNRIDDEVLFSIEVTEGDIAQIVSIVNQTLEKTDELWKLHGLDPNNELTVDQNGRSVDDIEQVFTKVGDQLKVNRN